MQLGTPRCAFAGASCASGYGERVLTVLIVLVLLVAAVAALWSAVARAEAASRRVAGLEPTDWRAGAEELRHAAGDLSDAVGARERR